MEKLLPKVSVIIPVYNGEKHLKKCLNSVINQTFKDFEIICIDDKSTDSSPKTLKEYAKNDSRINIITQEENMGVSYNRKIGIDNAKGEYVLFIDQDDWLRKDAIEKVYTNGSSNNSDIVFFDACLYFQDIEKYTFAPINDMSVYFDENTDFNNKTFTYEDIKPHVLSRSFAPWYKLYKTSFMREYDDFYFEKDIILHDTPLHLQIIFRANRISVCPEKLYYYRLSSYNTTFTVLTRKKGFHEVFNLIKTSECILKENGKLKEFKLEFIEFVLRVCSARLDTFETNLKESFFSRIKDKFIEMGIQDTLSLDKNKKNINPKEYKFYKRIISSKNYLEFFNKEKLENNEEKVKLVKEKNKLKKELSKEKKINKKNIHIIKSMEHSKSWKITKPLRKSTKFFKKFIKLSKKLINFRGTKKIFISGASHPLLLYLLMFGVNKGDMFIANRSIPKDTAKKLNLTFFPNCTNEKMLMKNILKLRAKLFFKTLFKNMEIYGNDHMPYSFPFYENEDCYLLEDGIGNYRLKSLFPLRKDKKNITKFEKFKKRFLLGDYNQYYRFGRKSPVKKIYLTGLSEIPKEIKSKVKILDIKELWDKKTEQEKKAILNVYSITNETFSMFNKDTIIFLTQPFSEINLLTLEEEINLYKEILSHYNPKNILIKPHPSEQKNYFKLLGEYTIITDDFISEFLFLLDVDFEKVVTINSSGVLCFEENKIEFLGTDIHPKILERYGKMTLKSLRNGE